MKTCLPILLSLLVTSVTTISAGEGGTVEADAEEVVPVEEKCRQLMTNDTLVRKLGSGYSLLGTHQDGSPAVSCTSYIEASTSVGSKSPAEDVQPKRVFLDYVFTFQGRGKEGDWCLLLKNISLAKISEEREKMQPKKRIATFLPSRLFYLLASSSDAGLNVSVESDRAAGVLRLDTNCTETGRFDDSCILDMSLSNLMTGDKQGDNLGLIDFSLTSFNYSYQDTSYPDYSKQGKLIIKELPGKNIRSLSLRDNPWTKMEPGDVPIVQQATFLDLSGTPYTSFTNENFDSLQNVTFLNFSYNNLEKIPEFVKHQQHLRVFDFRGNKDAKISDLQVVLQNKHQLEELHIGGVRIQYLFSNTIPTLPKLKILSVTGCQTVSIAPDAFQSFPLLEELDLSNNRLTDGGLGELPVATFGNLKHLHTLRLDGNAFTEGQLLMLHNLTLLNFSRNGLQSPDDLVHSGFVKSLDLSRNLIKDVGYYAFQKYNKPWVDFVNMSQNRIEVISRSDGYSLNMVRQVDLTDNQFDCGNCYVEQFQDWLRGNPRILPPPSRVQCVNQTNAMLEDVLNATLDEKCRVNYGLYVGTPIFSITVLIATVGLLLHHYRFEISYVMHLINIRKRSKDTGKSHADCLYDAFVSYSGMDRHWVLRVMQPMLENPEYPYRLCLHDRDFTLGSYIDQNIVESIDRSRKTILVLTKNFVDSQWCRYEMEMANHRLFNDNKEFLILLELERLERSDLPRHLRFLMDTRTYLEWPEEDDKKDVFWRRLTQALGSSIKDQIRKMETEKMNAAAVSREALLDDYEIGETP